MTATKVIPLVSYLDLADPGGPVLHGNRCLECGAVFFDRRNGCASCGTTSFERVPLGRTGSLLSFTIVHRAAPKVPAPYISAVVELDGGGVIKANLVDTAPDASSVPLGGRVRLTTFVAGADDDGTEAIAFGFSPIDTEE